MDLPTCLGMLGALAGAAVTAERAQEGARGRQVGWTLAGGAAGVGIATAISALRRNAEASPPAQLGATWRGGGVGKRNSGTSSTTTKLSSKQKSIQCQDDAYALHLFLTGKVWKTRAFTKERKRMDQEFVRRKKAWERTCGMPFVDHWTGSATQNNLWNTMNPGLR